MSRSPEKGETYLTSRRRDIEEMTKDGMACPEMDLSQFECRRCNECCRQEGYVRLEKGEPEKIADFLKMDLWSFTDQFTRLTRDRQSLSLTENTDHSCIFLNRNGCRIDPVKPRQCREFPFSWRFRNWHRICAWAADARGDGPPAGSSSVVPSVDDTA